MTSDQGWQTYRILGAMASLSDFTVRDLEQYTGASPRVIQAVVRKSRYLMAIPEPGEPQRYQLRDDQRDSLVDELRTLEDTIPSSSVVAAPGEWRVRAIEGLRLAKDLVVNELPLASDASARRNILSRALLAVDDARRIALMSGLAGSSNLTVPDSHDGTPSPLLSLIDELGDFSTFTNLPASSSRQELLACPIATLVD